MKAIILAAGKGTRLDKYTKNLPKGMLEVFNKPLIQHQVDCYNRNGITDIVIVKGYCSEKIKIEGTRSYYNPLFSETNMVESLFCAESELNGDIIISYSDVLFEDKALQAVISFKENIGVLVDKDWKDYWLARYDKVDFDTESLRVDADGKIVEIGASDPPIEEIDGRYVGMIRLSDNGCKHLHSVYYGGKQLFSGKQWLNGRLFEKIYMTDILQELIHQRYKVSPIFINRGWLEFDTNEDYERVLKLEKENKLQVYFNLV